VPRFLKVGRTGLVVGAGATVVVLAAVLKVVGVLGTAAQVFAFATAVLATASVALAAGVLSGYAELKAANQRLTDQLSRSRAAEIAQVEIERFSGPGELLRINIRNGSQRAIKDVYVWADVRGVPGHYAAGVPGDDPLSRRMVNVPHPEGLHWRLRVIHPGRQAFFTQLVHLNPHPLPAAADAAITAFAEFTDADGSWWRCDEDGNVIRREIDERETPDQPMPAQPPALRGPAPEPPSAPQPRLAGRLTPGQHGPQHSQRPPLQTPQHYSDVP
jgi:hypothetical protein